jgi:hypothetical protein
VFCHWVNPLPSTDSIRLNEVGRCIYCGETKGKLGTEHIIPESLGGALLLPEATCDCGPGLSHAFEGDVARDIFQFARRQARVLGKKNRRKSVPKTLPLALSDSRRSGTKRRVDIPIGDHPSILLLPRLSPLYFIGTGSYMPGRQNPDLEQMLLFGNLVQISIQG